MRGGTQMAKSKKTAVQSKGTAPEGCGLDLESLCVTCGSPAPEGRMVPGMLSALKRHETLLAEIERVSSTGGFCWHPATGKVTCTGEVYRIFELEATVPLTLQLIATRIHPDDLTLLDNMLERASAQESGFEYQLRLRSETVKYLLLSARRRDGADDQALYIGAIRDVTRRRLSEEALDNVRCELARVARVWSLGALTASIAHEINQPLAGIMINASTCLDLLSSDPPDLDAARETARRTIRDSERACEVIARLRALFGKRGGKTESVDLNGVAREVIALSLSDLHRRGVTLRTELADDLALVTGDRVQLLQVILNLLLNAAEAMSPIEDRPRQVLIRSEYDADDQVRLSVQDTGVGFESHHAQRLFEPFYTTKSGGMGIGLSVSRSIVENHGGRLWGARNAGPGATFAFSIPVCGTRCSAHKLSVGGALADAERLRGARRVPASVGFIGGRSPLADQTFQ
jgi:signal transduction histidine kinase